MSLTKNTGCHQMKCGDINLQVVGTDPNLSGVKLGSSITALTGDYSPGDGYKNPDQTFFIIPETAGVFYVTLFDGSDFIISAVQSAAYLGQVWPGKIFSVNVGTTGNFSVAY
jgi:hypothetical protein